MNIQHNHPQVKKTKVQVLSEAFMKHKNVSGFLMECGNTTENNEIYQQLALNESFDADHRFTFENGMYVPGLNSRTKGRLSLSEIAKKSPNAEAFLVAINEGLTKPYLEFELTESDKTALIEAYNNRNILHS